MQVKDLKTWDIPDTDFHIGLDSIINKLESVNKSFNIGSMNEYSLVLHGKQQMLEEANIKLEEKLLYG